jgi:hypothetical protein
MKKYTFCDDWTKIVAQRWFGARIYPRALNLGSWPLNFRIKILKYTFSLVFVGKKLSLIGPTFQKIIGDKLVTDRQTTNRHFWADPHPYGNFFFFFCIWEGENEWGEIYTSLLATQVGSLTCFAFMGIKNKLYGSTFFYFTL